MDTMSEYLSSYAADLEFDDLPPEVVRQAKRLIVDTLGCAIGGFHGEPSRIAMKLAASVSSDRPATILCSGQRTAPDLAAFANGVMIRYLDYNDGYTGKETCHPSDTIAAILPASEVAHADGKTFLTATVLAYEVFCRLCDAVSVRSRGFDHVTLGVIASGVGAAKAMGLSHEKIIQTVNLCVAPYLALYQTRIGEVSMWKGCAFGNASRNAVFAALLAELGLTGPSPIFEGPGGFYNTASGGPFTLDSFGGAKSGHPEGSAPPEGPDPRSTDTATSGPEHFKIMEASVKRFPLGLYSQTVVEAALEVRGKLPGIENIAAINVRTLKTAVDIMAGDREKWNPANRETADHSLPYTAAVALMYGTVEPRHFDDQYLHNRRLLDLVQKINVSVSEEANRRSPEAMLSTVEVVTASGGRFLSPEVPYHRGHWKNPMTEPELEEKFRTLAQPMLTPAQTDALLHCLWDLEEVEDIGQLIELTRP